MIEKIIFPNKFVGILSKKMNSSNEYGGFILGEQTSGGIYLRGWEIIEGQEESFDFDKDTLAEYFSVCQMDPSRFKIALFHMHNRLFGEKVRLFDPYWSVNPDLDSLKHKKGSVVNNFYISTKKGNCGDNVVLDYFYKRGVEYHVFVYPLFGSEMKIMNEDLIEVTAYKYSSKTIGRVREIDMGLAKL